MQSPRKSSGGWMVVLVVIGLMHLGARYSGSWGGTVAEARAAAPVVAAAVAAYNPLPDLQTAEAEIAQKRFRAAQLHLIRVLAQLPDHAKAVAMLLQVTASEMDELTSSGRFLIAGQRLAEAEVYFVAFRDAVLQNPNASTSVRVVQQGEQALSKLGTSLRARVSAEARKKLSEGERRANQAYRYVWFNNREDVRNGLRHVRWVESHFEYLNTETRGEYFRVLNLLKSRVSDREWAPLLSEAGFVTS